MNSRERVEMALNFEQPDRPPVFASFVPEIEARLRSEFNISDVDVGVGRHGNEFLRSARTRVCGCMGHPLALCQERFRGVHRDRRTPAGR